MPNYQHRCVKCERTTEAFYSIREDKIISCKYCGSKTKKLINAVPLHLKGDGFCLTTEQKKARSGK